MEFRPSNELVPSPAKIGLVASDKPPILSRADGRAMAYRRLGEGPIVVCLAGRPGSNALYLEDLGGLDRRHELIVPDMRGTGASDAAESASGYGFGEIAGDFEPLRTYLGLAALSLIAGTTPRAPTATAGRSRDRDHPGRTAATRTARSCGRPRHTHSPARCPSPGPRP